ncbi:autotransporter assembly complex protein TamA [Vibrio sp. SCSIO 43137]|uniref:autotransporter assembly complex protein TamA n=1 Tax=Vibrio sp. SCSIO 43137 TaxID=3021011 RepID=UPI0023073869|nr:autotransporter assembly complex family protein [Vibrio sp. SCSIO 43137]WCE29426.1 autotransporter assembly complex protein TamA [Vibrio sp. SCSIO 43137]
MVKKCALIFVTLLFSSKLWADVSVEIKGLDGALEENVEAYLTAIPKEDYSVSLRFQSQLRKSFTKALQALGHYQPEFVFVTSEDDKTLTVNIAAGEPVRISISDIRIDGAAGSDKDFLTLVEKSGLEKGEILNHAKYDALKSAIRNLALSKGYFDGTFTKTVLEVAPERNQAFIYLYYQSGIRYQFGETKFSGNQIQQSKLRSLIPYQKGDPYLSSKIGVFNQNLSNTEWFSSVLVQPDISVTGKQEQLPMLVTLSPQTKNQLETGIGYSTDLGVKGTLKWKKPWVNSLGHSFDSALSLSAPEQAVTLGYNIPLEDVQNEYYRLQYGMKYEDKNDTESFEASALVERHWQLDSGWHRVLYGRYLHEDFKQGTQDDEFTMILPGISFSKVQTSGGAMPLSGDKQSIAFEYSDKSLTAKARVYRVLAKTAWIRSIGQNHRGIARLDASANFVDEISNIPPSIRFFAGGDNSLRGYDYESISPRDSKGALTGAKYLATSSLEYQYRLTGNWWLAGFVDYGDAWNNTIKFKTGTGFGVRWASPVGPVRIDFAWGLDEKPGEEFKLHFTLGPEL